MKTSRDVVEAALRRIGVVGMAEPLTADQEAQGREALEGLLAEIKTEVAFTWTAETVPGAVFLPLAALLAVEVAPSYDVPRPGSYSRAWHRLMAVLRPDDRDDEPMQAEYF